MNRARAVGMVLAASLLALAPVEARESSSGRRFEWTTESQEAKSLLTDLQARIENFQFGTDTIDVARKLVAADPEFAMGAYYLSAVAPSPEAEGELEKAVNLAKKASDGERRFIEAMVIARGNGGANFRDAIEPLEKLASDYPGERLVQVILGQLYQGTNQSDKARAAFEKTQAIGPRSRRVQSFLANDDLLRGDYGKARASFEAIQKELPQGAAPAPIRYGVAFSYLYQAKPDAAVQSLEAFLEEYRKSGATQGFPEVFIWNSIARIRLENGAAAEALRAYEKGYEAVPASGLPDDQKELWLGRMRHGRSRALAKLGRHEEAWTEAVVIRKMIDEGGESAQQQMPAYHYLVGYLKLEAGEPEAAVEHLQQTDPSDPFSKLLLGRAFEKLGDLTSAKKAYQEVVESTNNGMERALAFPEAKRKLAKI